MADDLDGEFAEHMIVFIGESLRGSHNDTFTCVDSEGVEVLHVADSDTIVETVAHHLILHFFPSLKGFLHQYLGRERERLLHEFDQFLAIVAETGSETSEGISGTDNHGISETVGSHHCILHRAYSLALDCLDIDLIKFLDEKLAVFGIHYSTYGGAQDADIMFFKNAVLIEFDAAVESGLTSECKEDTIGALLLYHLLHEIGSDRKEINLIGKPFGSLHRSDVGVDEDCLNILLPHSLEGLRAGIIEFSGLPNLERSGT